jgi:hypothetical protein
MNYDDTDLLFDKFIADLDIHGLFDKFIENEKTKQKNCESKVSIKYSIIENGEQIIEEYVIVRTVAMGVFAGYLSSESTETVKILKNARRIWKWAGAASLSELAILGTSNPDECKFPIEVDSVTLTSPGGFEILKVSDKAKKSIASVPVWTAH